MLYNSYVSGDARPHGSDPRRGGQEEERGRGAREAGALHIRLEYSVLYMIV